MIKSDLTAASSYASEHQSAASNLMQDISAHLDEMTTVQGNRKAHTVISLSNDTASSINTAFEEAASNLESVAIGFELLDAEQAKQFI